MIDDDNRAGIAVKTSAASRVVQQCRCTLAQRVVGDGCEVCNPELAQRLAAEAQADAIKETTR